MGTDAGDPPMVEHQDAVGTHDGGDALRHDERRGAWIASAQRGAQAGVRGEVEGGGGVIEQQQVGLAHQRARDREALALATGEVTAAGLDGRVEAGRLGADEVRRLGQLERMPQLPVAGPGVSP